MDEQNAHPLNQAAKRLLEQAGRNADPTGLYLLQLAERGLEVHSPRQSLVDRLPEVLEKLEAARPELAMKFLLEPADGDPDERAMFPADLEGLSPEDAAVEVIELLHTQAGEKVWDYPRALME